MASVFDSDEYQQNLRNVGNDVVEQIKELRMTLPDSQIFLMIRQGFDNFIQRSGMFEKATCQKGCSFCCHDRIIVSKMEIDHIKAVVKAKGITPNRERLQKQKKNFANLKWKDKACPLLSEPNEKGERICMIYEDRPMVCRSHNSMEEPKFCNKNVYPARSIQEGRILELDALSMGLIMVDVPKGAQDYRVALHNVL